MALNFQPYEQPRKTKTEALLEPITRTVEQAPTLIMQYEKLKREREMGNQAYELQKENLSSEAKDRELKRRIDLFNAQIDALQKAQGFTRPDAMGQPVTYPGIKNLTEAISFDDMGAPRLDWNIVAPGSRPPSGAGSPIDDEYKKARTEYYKSQAGDVPERQEEREYRRRERRNAERKSIVDRFNADPSVKKSQQMIDGANIISDLATSGNPIAAAAIPTFMARASGEVGNLSEADKRPFGGSKAILRRLEAALNELATGQLSEANQKFILDLSATMRRRAESNMYTLAQKRSKQYAGASDFLSDSDILATLMPDYDAPAEPAADEPAPALPQVGDTFQGGKVLNIRRVE